VSWGKEKAAGAHMQDPKGSLELVFNVSLGRNCSRVGSISIRNKCTLLSKSKYQNLVIQQNLKNQNPLAKQ